MSDETCPSEAVRLETAPPEQAKRRSCAREGAEVNMQRSAQIELAREFRKMHLGPRLLLLPNAWDAVSAKLYEMEGFRAVGTTSAGISAALGFPDGERMSLEDNLAVCRRMVDHVAIPVSVDIEAGYGECLDGLSGTITKVIASGAVGVNIEDSAKAGCGGHERAGLLEPSAQGDRIAAARKAADLAGVPMVINARTDVFLQRDEVSEERIAEAIHRGNVYRSAGADCVFVPDMGVLGEVEIAALASKIEAPLNLVAGRKTPSVQRLEALGVARLSFGPRPMRAALGFLRAMAREWLATGTYSRLTSGESLSYDEVNAWFTP
jgi:2-methylisocitrate lyase-like PEP mutase family enzyme